MDLENLKSDYQNSKTDNLKSLDNLTKMKEAKNHPVLKGIIKQLVIESLLWTIILLVYYDFFDGQLKSFLWNALLVISILLLLIHNISGYILVKNPIFGESIKESLQKYLVKIKTFSFISIVSRVLAVTVFLGFLVSNVEWEFNKMVLTLALFLITIGTQIYLLRKVWKKRIHLIENTLATF